MKAKFTILIILLLTVNAYSYELCSRSNIAYVSPNSVVYDSTIDIKYYGLNLLLTTNPNYLSSIANVKGDFIIQNNLLFLNLGNPMIVDSVTGQGVTGFSHLNNILNVNFDNIRNSFDIRVYYKGLPGGSGFGSFAFSTQNSIPVIWSLSEPFGSSDWFPNKNTPSDKSDSSEVWITCASNLTGVSNGLLYETLSNPDNTKNL